MKGLSKVRHNVRCVKYNGFFCLPQRDIYLLNVDKKSTKKRYKICSDLTMKTFNDIGVSLLNIQTYTPFSSVSIVGFKQGNVYWATIKARIIVIFDNV